MKILSKFVAIPGRGLFIIMRRLWQYDPSLESCSQSPMTPGAEAGHLNSPQTDSDTVDVGLVGERNHWCGHHVTMCYKVRSCYEQSAHALATYRLHCDSVY